MSEGFEPAYAYARVCGSLARSFLGERAAALAGSARVGEAWRAVFGASPPALPENALADAAERALRARAAEALAGIAGPLVRDEPFFAALIRRWEIAGLKDLLSAAASLAPEAPESSLPVEGLALGYDPSGYPDLGKMLRGTRYAWAVESGLGDLPAVKNRLDRQYFAELWEALAEVPEFMAGSLRSLVRLEAELANAAWALRLKRYYSYAAGDIEGLLIELPGVDVRASALDAASRRLDSRPDWELWKWERFVPDARQAGGDWAMDIRLFESATRRFLFRLLYRRLHLEPDTYVPLYAFYRIKEFETTAIHGVIEGIKLEAQASEIAAFAVDATGGAA